MAIACPTCGTPGPGTAYACCVEALDRGQARALDALDQADVQAATQAALAALQGLPGVAIGSAQAAAVAGVQGVTLAIAAGSTEPQAIAEAAGLINGSLGFTLPAGLATTIATTIASILWPAYAPDAQGGYQQIGPNGELENAFNDPAAGIDPSQVTVSDAPQAQQSGSTSAGPNLNPVAGRLAVFGGGPGAGTAAASPSSSILPWAVVAIAVAWAAWGGTP